MNTQNNDPFNQLQQGLQTINSGLEGISNNLAQIKQDTTDIKTEQLTIDALQKELEQIYPALKEISDSLPQIKQGIDDIQTKQLTISQLQQELKTVNDNLAQIKQDTGVIETIQLTINELQQELEGINHILQTIYGNTDKSPYDLYDIYRDHMKHEDTLGNQRINILLASQSFLFFPYFSILKDYRNNGYSGYDSLLLLGIFSLGIGINLIIRPSILGFIDASSHIRNQWKRILFEDNNRILNDYFKKYKVNFESTKLFDDKPLESIEKSGKIDEPNDIEAIGFITLDGNNDIPNIGYENPDKDRRDNINKYSNQLFFWFIVIWIALFIIPFVSFRFLMPLDKLPEKVKLEEMLDKIYQEELINKKNQAETEKQEAEDKVTNYKSCIEQITNEMTTTNTRITGQDLKTKLNSCLNP